MAVLGGKLGLAEEAAVLGSLEGGADEAAAKPAVPTMMSKEARSLLASEDGPGALRKWKVRVKYPNVSLDGRDTHHPCSKHPPT